MQSKQLQYQRLVFGYHGCDRSIRDQVLCGKGALKESANNYDWLGGGIYFWESGKARALEWARQQQKRGKLLEPAVIGALIQLGNCFDLLDVEYTGVLASAYPEFTKSLAVSKIELPKNSPLSEDDPDFLLRRADCAVMNWTLKRYEEASRICIQTVRGVFQEGEAAFPGSAIKRRSHIQIAVRDTSCIAGYFLPQ